jgi:arylesterase/paraoxonase
MNSQFEIPHSSPIHNALKRISNPIRKLTEQVHICPLLPAPSRLPNPKQQLLLILFRGRQHPKIYPRRTSITNPQTLKPFALTKKYLPQNGESQKRNCSHPPPRSPSHLLTPQQSLALLAASAPYLYGRYVAFSGMFAHRPSVFQNVTTFRSQTVKFADKVRNCEDVVMVETLGVAFLSCDPGRDGWNTVMVRSVLVLIFFFFVWDSLVLMRRQGTFLPTNPRTDGHAAIWMYDYTSPSGLLTRLVPSPELPDFHPLGIAFDAPSATLYVINHSRFSGPVIEIFTLDIAAATLQHKQSFTHDLLHAPNALHILGDGKLYVSNDHYITARTSLLLSKIETFANVPGGSVAFVDIKNPAESKIVARLGFANGVARLNESTLVVASTSAPGIYFYDIDTATFDLKRTDFVRTPAAPDNLSVDAAGRLLIVGHPFAPRLMGVSQRRAGCVDESDDACRCDSPSWVGEWSEEKGLRTVLADGGGEVCSSSTAVRDVGRGVGVVSMLYGRGIVVFEE